MAGCSYDLYRRDIIECIRALFGNPAFTQDLVFAPERHYTDGSRSIRIYHEMHTGQWWWETQVSILVHGHLPLLDVLLRSSSSAVNLAQQ